MRLIDKTPFLEEDGSISFIHRIQGTLQYGFSWYPNLQVQKKVIAIFEKQLDKKFTLICNPILGTSKIMVPFILIGPPGIQVFLLTNEEGMYRSKSDSWEKIESGKYKDAGINLVKRTAKIGKAVEVYLKKQNIEIPEGIEAIFLAVNPKITVEAARPSVRILMSDAIERFAASLRQAPPIMVVADVHQISEAILNPVQPKEDQPEETPLKKSAPNQSSGADNFGDDNFSFDNEKPAAPSASTKTAPHTAARRTARKTSNFGLFGMTNKQLIILAVMAGFIALVLVAIIIIALISL